MKWWGYIMVISFLIMCIGLLIGISDADKGLAIVLMSGGLMGTIVGDHKLSKEMKQ